MKKVIILLFMCLFTLSLFGCVDSQSEDKIYDADMTADALNAQLRFGEQLEKSTADALFSIYGIDPSLCTKAAFYAGSGATADEIAVFNCNDKDAFDSVLTAVNSRIEYLRNGYSSYGPDQVPKIDSASVITNENTIILCICENPDAVNSVLETVE